MVRIEGGNLPELRQRQVARVLLEGSARDEGKRCAGASGKPRVDTEAEGHRPITGIADRNLDLQPFVQQRDLLPRLIFVRIVPLGKMLNQTDTVRGIARHRPRSLEGVAMDGDILLSPVDWQLIAAPLEEKAAVSDAVGEGHQDEAAAPERIESRIARLEDLNFLPVSASPIGRKDRSALVRVYYDTKTTA